MYRHIVKRILDLMVATLALLILAVPLTAVAIITKLDSPGPILFRQRRIGRRGKPFTMLKFRSMATSAPKDTPTHLLTEAVPLTRWQRFMRRSSIDELPQLFNILTGHMSLIGPRPALWNQFELIELRDRCGANDVLPGLSGWAQVNGRDFLGLDEEKKAQYDGEYAKNISFGFDVKCLALTVVNVLGMRGVADGDEGKNPSEPSKTEE